MTILHRPSRTEPRRRTAPGRRFRRCAARTLAAIAAPALLAGPGCAGEVGAQEPLPAMGNPAVSFLAATPGFRFHSDFWTNLHQYLYGIAGGGPELRAGFPVEAAGCFDALEGSAAEGWRKAVAHYEAHLGEREHRVDPLMRAIRYALNGLGDEHPAEPGVGEALDALEAAAPAYRSCLWERHDARNRALASDLVGVLVRHAAPVQERLSALYRAGWPRGVPVDLVSYTAFSNANTTSGPGVEPHVMLATAQGRVAGFEGMETLLHEASHLMFGAFHGAVTRALRASADSLGVALPRSLWHAVSFHTSGELVRQAAAAAGVAHEPYWIERDLFSAYRPAIEEHWQPYVVGQTGLEEAARRLVEALTSPPEPPVEGGELVIRLANDTQGERATRDRLRGLLDRYDLSPWIMTREVLVDETAIPHSHPVLTLRNPDGDDDRLLATFLHEQLHWWVLENGDLTGARSAFEKLFPDVPSAADGGARDDRSTWLHLVVCDLELQALAAVVGEERAREVLSTYTHYEWVYERVLDDPRVREVNERFGMIVPTPGR